MDDANVARMRSAVQNFPGNPDFRTTRQALYPKRLDVLPRVRVRSDHCPLPRDLSPHAGAQEVAHVAVGVVRKRLVHGDAVVPHHEVPVAPVVGVDVVPRPLAWAKQRMQGLAAFLRLHFDDAARESGIDVQRPAPRLELRAYHRMRHRRHAGRLLGRQRAVGVVGEYGLVGQRVVMHRVASIDAFPDTGGQRLAGSHHAGEHRLAPSGRHLPGMEHRGERRTRGVGEVGVPVLPGVDGADRLSVLARTLETMNTSGMPGSVKSERTCTSGSPSCRVSETWASGDIA